jgi:hypothetical protein
VRTARGLALAGALAVALASAFLDSFQFTEGG